MTGKNIRIDIVSDVVCPWCIIGYKQLEAALNNTRTAGDIHWHPFQLAPDMPAEGRNLLEHLAKKYNRSHEEGRQNRQRITDTGAALGFQFNYRDDMRVYNTFRAHQLLHWAALSGHQHDLKLALITAFFGQRQNIDDPDILAAVAQSVGLDAKEALAVLDDERYATNVQEEERHWREQGIQGVPAMIFQQRYLVSGAQGIDNYVSILQQIKEQPL
ncbi:MAG: disulfide bond formation protein DsbA [Kordiimonas sp.]|nr:disulfide bond formation protein DsbA [Kordiimonas sp.]|tara:strand:- start:2673 stop:3320 length:648 start_codon:yes stop_codon:yes gene_type:complete